MLSKVGMFDAIAELRKETNRKYGLLDSVKIDALWNLYKECHTKAEFKEKAKALLQWQKGERGGKTTPRQYVIRRSQKAIYDPLSKSDELKERKSSKRKGN